eukprot:TRINITY_DN3288_c1_g1_i1.p1 TRINITY_DN3288_c1_g1~~TRINITY_DN3288_c1_g1_i1.p1  ORF type:complete len:506 (+),score=84.20 TRINITY_DN3288_c1_g1_i1:72-1520(+)
MSKFICESKEEETVTPNPSLSVVQLVGLLFVATIGGAYGIEECVRSGGGFWTIVGVMGTPWVWGLPTALVVAELATSIPSNAGAVMWVNLTSPTWLTLTFVGITGIANFVDNSLYPNLLTTYIFTPSSSPFSLAVTKATAVLLSTAVNIMGIDVVGNSGSVFMILTILPFLLVFLLKAPEIGFKTVLTHVPASSPNWGKFLPLLSWNMSGFDGAGHIVEEVQSPGRTLVKGFVSLLIITEVVYVLPVLSAVGTGKHPPEEWVPGYWAIVAEEAGGSWLKGFMKLGGVVSCFGFMTAVICTTSRAIQGIAMLGVLPDSVSVPLRRIHPVYRTPVNAILFNSFITLLLSLSMEFSVLIDVGQMLYSARLLLIFFSAVWLRVHFPDLKRPFKIPFGTVGLVAATGLPSVFCVVLLAVAASGSPDTAAIFSIMVVFVAAFSCTATWFCVTVELEGKIVTDGCEVRSTHGAVTPPPQLEPRRVGSLV